MTGPRDRRLEALFQELKQEDRTGAPDFASMLSRAKAEAEKAGSAAPVRRRRRVMPLWRALPAGTILAAAGLGAIALFGSPSSGEAEFRAAVDWVGSDPLFGAVGAASDVLLETPQWALLKPAGSGSLSGLSDMLRLPAALPSGSTDERNES